MKCSNFKRIILGAFSLFLLTGCVNNGNVIILPHIVSFKIDGVVQKDYQVVEHLGKAKEPTHPGDREGFTFEGWKYKDNIWSFESNIVKSNMVLEASYKPSEYDVTLITNGSSYHEDHKKVTYLSNYELGTASQTGYDFTGWYTEDNSKGIKYTDNQGKSLELYSKTEGITLYAGFSYTINFYTNCGYVIPSITKIKGEESELDLSTFIPIREGVNFEGWYENKQLTKPAPNNMVVNKSTALYAKWEGETSTYYFTYRRDDSSNKTTIVNLFSSLSGTDIKFPSYIDNYKITNIGSDIMGNVHDVTKVIIPEGIEEINEKAFENCPSLETVEIPESVVTIGSSAFYNCPSLKSIKLPSNLKSIPGLLFGNCPSLESVELPSNLKNIDNRAFLGCVSLASIVIPNGVTKIGDEAFINCGSLKSVSIPSSVTKIGEGAFSSCHSLKTAYLSRSTRIGTNAFPTTCTIEYYD